MRTYFLLLSLLLLSGCMGHFAQKPAKSDADDPQQLASQSLLPDCGSANNVITCDWGKS